jgi:molybdopterin synthase sulfur carrier subunit
MRVTVRYFARVRERLGPEEAFEWEADAPRTVGALWAWLQARSPAHAEALAEGQCLRTALNQTLCDADEPLPDGAEVAFFPPVTGG